ncbi:copper chaperone CopZ [Homoserinimonas aerilata]|uniref:Copper chaperone CopZ n=1 Tax=Homoserinimonas aerilata TaxID=1162970 RepID=A0A542YH47_9MICO|nr:heavy-metal-associated domain-containing protein [Homoserinimonas aerilata]TQL47425.1 copper chaperone CopZ [Homoserinimonas aerilata]
MCSIHIVNDLGLAEKGSSGCACGAGHSTPVETALSEKAVTTTLAVSGMTCGHCVSTVTEELSAIDGVQSVNVQLNAGGVSSVSVASDSMLDPTTVRSALDEAGYSLVGA